MTTANDVVAARAGMETARARYLETLRDARAAGVSDVELGAALGISRQRVWQLARVPKPKAAEPTEDQLRGRLAELDERWDALIAKLAPAFEPTDPRREQLARNTHNGLVARAESGRRRDGRWNGQVGYRGRRLRTVADETRLLAEREILRSLAKHPEDPVVVKINAELVEAREIRERLNQLGEARCGF